MAGKEEIQTRKAAKLESEKLRIAGMKAFEQEEARRLLQEMAPAGEAGCAYVERSAYAGSSAYVERSAGENQSTRVDHKAGAEHDVGKGHKIIICGIDEAGRGPFAGPVVAGAVILDVEDPDKEILYLNDSKKLSEKKREMLYREILGKAVAVGIGYGGAQLIDRINILQATYHAMRMALNNLTPVSHLLKEDADTHELVRDLIRYELPESLAAPANISKSVNIQDPNYPSDSPAVSGLSNDLFSSVISDLSSADYSSPPLCTSDGDSSSVFGSTYVSGKSDNLCNLRIVPDCILADAVHIPDISIPQKGIVKGDAKCLSIAAGSIVAKVTRDHIMYEYDRIYPEYGFASHKGYGTKAHIEAIRLHGMTPIHRRSFIHF